MSAKIDNSDDLSVGVCGLMNLWIFGDAIRILAVGTSGLTAAIRMTSDPIANHPLGIQLTGNG
jgi:hypothetical protein